MTTDKDLRALAEAATDGPWEIQDRRDNTQGKRTQWYEVGNWPVMVAHIQAGDLDEENAAFIAAANPQTVIGLLDRIEAGWTMIAKAAKTVADLKLELSATRPQLEEAKATLDEVIEFVEERHRPAYNRIIDIEYAVRAKAGGTDA